MPTLLQRPTLCSRNTYPRVHVRERMYGHIHTYKLAAVASLEQGGDNKICDNQPQRRRRRHDALSDELSGDVRHVTCTSTPLLSFSPFSCPPSLFVLLPFVSHMPISILISTSTYSLHFHHRFCPLLSFPSYPLCPHIVLSNSLTSSLLYPLQASCSHYHEVYHFEVGSYPVSTTSFPARFVNNSFQPLKHVTMI